MRTDDDLFRWAETQRTPSEENTLREAFEKFDEQHPEVYAMFERFTLELVAGGFELGAKAVWERMRWETAVGASNASSAKYRLNNNYTAYYARMFMDRHPEHARVFQTRRVRS